MSLFVSLENIQRLKLRKVKNTSVVILRGFQTAEGLFGHFAGGKRGASCR